MEKTFSPADVESRIYAAWEAEGAFKAGRPERAGADTFCVVIPPPNVTGSLHMGHALNNTLQDILCRYERLKGKDVLWQPGTDHAGIATQMVVERKLASENRSDRRTMGREAFLKEVWSWKAESGGTIINQLKRLGASCDWSRERFTMDEGLSKAVVKVFVELYKKGLIYKAKRLVNWDPKLLTAISDLEVENRETDGHMWHFKYPLAGGQTYTYVEKDADGNITFQEERDYIAIATTRPETMLGDGAVAVHPSDERYRPIIGKLCEIPVGPKEHRRLVPIIADEYPDPEFGSGAVKITGAHDFNDYQVAVRNNLPLYRLMDENACMRSDGTPHAEGAAMAAQIIASGTLPGESVVDTINLVPDAYRGLDRYEARKLIVAAINAEGLSVTTTDKEGNVIPLVESKKMMQPFGDRSGVVIEPMLTDQWFADAKTLAQPALEAVRSGRTQFVPKQWEKTYFEWLDNIQPWCVSRQLWWGHQIPAWYGPDGAVFVEATEEDAKAAARAHYGKDEALTRDEDVLDTWFSSALWPFSTLGWPDDTAELKRYYPTNVLVTGFDIIFFWVARMMMMGLHFMEEIPFHDIYIHALVRDEKGAKMSKSKGNVIDPLDLIEQYGADALRFTLAAMAAQGRDIKLATSRVEGYRNFSTKLWNAARFAEMNACERTAFDPKSAKTTLARWIIGETSAAVTAIEEALAAYKFNEAAGAAYGFVWNIFCDWFLEFAKPVFNGTDEAAKAEVRATTAWVLDQILVMLHPFMPFITEELWSVTGEKGPNRKTSLVLSQWPQLAGLEDPEAEAEMGLLVDLISQIRSVRAEMNVAPGAQVPFVLVNASEKTKAVIDTYSDLFKRMARLSDVSFVTEAPKGSVQILVRGEQAALPLAGIVDIAAEKARLNKEKARAEDDIKRVDQKLSNANFVARAPEEVIEGEKEKREEASARLAKVMEALARLADLG